MYNNFQKQIYQNKIDRKFNVTDIGKEIILMTEELGELSDALIECQRNDIIDAIGDLMVYGLGLCSMFCLDSDNIINRNLKCKRGLEITFILNYIVREVGMIAKTYKKSNKKSVDKIDNKYQFKKHIGNLLRYCELGLNVYENEGAVSVLEKIINNNKTRSHSGQM